MPNCSTKPPGKKKNSINFKGKASPETNSIEKHHHKKNMNNHTLENGASKRYQTRDIGPSVRICQLNIEGISKAKCDNLSRILLENNIDVAAIQETHCIDESNIMTRGKITGYTLIGALYHRAYGIATYAKSSIENITLVEAKEDNNIYLLTIDIAGIQISNIYKPPNAPWPDHTLPILNHPSMYVGDFNSHHNQWGYRVNDENGENLCNWAEANNLFLVFDAKDKGTFHSGRWHKDYNPDLCFVTCNAELHPLQTSRRVLPNFPHSQHRPVILECGTKIPIVNTIPRPRWNFNKATWKGFASALDSNIRWIPPTTKNYKRFVGVVITTAKKYIPRGFRKEYIPGWSAESNDLYLEYLRNGEPDIADSLLRSLDKSRADKWAETMKNVNFTHSSRKAWRLLRKLGGCSNLPSQKSTISPNKIAIRIVDTAKAKSDKAHTIEIKRALSELKRKTPESSNFSSEFTMAELEKALDKTKISKAAGADGIFPEFLKSSGKNTKLWLCKFFNNIMETGILPKEFKLTKIIAVLKPGKEVDKPENYRPIALLSVCYKLLERLIYNRIENTVNAIIPVEQAGFRSGRSCVDQVLALTTHIENGFQSKLKTSAVFVDLTAAYDTVWRTGLVYKLLKVIPCKRMANLINNMLSNRMFKVFINDTESKPRMLNNGLPQGSVLAPLLFNLYIADIPETTARKFQYADDLALTSQHLNIDHAAKVLEEDLVVLDKYFRKWRLIPSMNKTESCSFHLNNKLANVPSQIKFRNIHLRHNNHPKYLGITLDRSLTFKQHLTNTAGKLKTRNNLLQKLASTTWGVQAAGLRTAALGLVFSTAEYGAPVWLNSAHINMVDNQLNVSMRLISGTIKSTPLPWLPVLSNIAPAELRRSNALIRQYNKICDNETLPIHHDINIIQNSSMRLKSRTPPIGKALNLEASNFDIEVEWRNSWKEFIPTSGILIDDPSAAVPGQQLPRNLWVKLNRLRTGHGRCGDFLFKWNAITSSACDCGELRQTMDHIVNQCPKRAFEGGGIIELHHLTDEALTWLRALDLTL